MLKAIGLSLAIAAIAGSASAGEWAIISRSDDLVFGVDRTSIRASGSLRTYWKVVVLRTPRMFEGKTYDYVLYRNRVDCEDWTAAGLYGVYYRIGNSAPVSSFELLGTSSAIVPDTLGDDEARFVCRDPRESLSAWAATADEFAIDRRTSPAEEDAAWREQRPAKLTWPSPAKPR
jgi:hypothetical protein